MEAKKSKNSAICAKRSEDPQSKEAGFNGAQGGYMVRESTNRARPQACPNYARSGRARPAAPPSALRKGFAFPNDRPNEQAPPRNLEGSAFQAGRRRKKGSALAGKPEAFRKAGRQSRAENRLEPLIWTALGKPSLYSTRVQSGGLQERMAMRRYVVHSRYRRIRPTGNLVHLSIFVIY